LWLIINQDVDGLIRMPSADKETQESELLDRVFFALADPARRRILRTLDGREMLVSELAAPFDISLQAVSRHIQVLVKAGLVKQERTGRVSRCRLEAGPIHQAAVWINQYAKYWQAQFDLLAAVLEQLEAKPAGKPAARRPRKPAKSPPARRRRPVRV
jgi:DNA-binding transcriptional ArsR family regulator